MLLKKLSNKMSSGSGKGPREPDEPGEQPRADVAEKKPARERPARTFGVRPAPAKKSRILPVGVQTFSPGAVQDLPPDFLKMVVNAQDSAPEAKRHNVGYMHLSELLKGVCPRAVRFTDENPDKQIYQAATGGHRVMWRMGRAAEAHIRESYIKGVKGEGVYGVWKCKCGAHEKQGYFAPEWQACGRCRTLPDNYHEYSLLDHEAGVVGNPDMLLRVAEPLYVMECKSMNGEDFDALQAPMPDHIYQGAGYRRLGLKNGLPIADKIIIIYVTKKFKFGSPYKEFHVDVNKPEIDRVLDGAWAKARLIRQSRKDNRIPDATQRVCKSMNSPQAKACPHCADCFMRG